MEDLLNFKFDKRIVKMMQSRGLDNSVLQGPSKLKFNLENSLVSFKPDIGEDIVTKTVSTAKQMSAIENVLEKPYYGHPVYCINSYPTDMRAKVIAANIMEEAMYQYIDRKGQRNPYKMPYWVRLYSDSSFGYIQKIKEQKPGLLIISNVTSNSTAQRIEKLRDILEYFDNIPRVVVQTGDFDPIKFFSNKLFMSVSHVARIGPDNRVNTSPLDI